jgi:hypothetical protein
MLRVASHWKATIHIYILKKFQKSKNRMNSQQAAQKRTEPFWLSWSFRVLELHGSKKFTTIFLLSH